MGSLSSGFLLLLLGGAALVVVIILLSGKLRKKEKRVCPNCGMELEDFMDECVYCSGVTDLRDTDELTTAAPGRMDSNDYENDTFDREDIEDTDVMMPDKPSPRLAPEPSSPIAGVIEDLSDYLLDDSEDDDKIMKQLQRTTILARVPSIEMIKGKKRLKKLRLGKELFYLGKELGCDVVIDEPGIESRHAVLKNEGKKVVVFALAQGKAIDVNGQLVMKKELEESDVIRIGSFSFVFRIEEQF